MDQDALRIKATQELREKLREGVHAELAEALRQTLTYMFQEIEMFLDSPAGQEQINALTSHVEFIEQSVDMPSMMKH